MAAASAAARRGPPSRRIIQVPWVRWMARLPCSFMQCLIPASLPAELAERAVLRDGALGLVRRPFPESADLGDPYCLLAAGVADRADIVVVVADVPGAPGRNGLVAPLPALLAGILVRVDVPPEVVGVPLAGP